MTLVHRPAAPDAATPVDGGALMWCGGRDGAAPGPLELDGGLQPAVIIRSGAQDDRDSPDKRLEGGCVAVSLVAWAEERSPANSTSLAARLGCWASQTQPNLRVLRVRGIRLRHPRRAATPLRQAKR